jgi:hypothetical protein
MNVTQKTFNFIIAAALIVLPFSLNAQPVTGGPVVLMGIDAEDASHPPAQNYTTLITSVYNQATNGGAGIAVLGGGKDLNDNVSTFWLSVQTNTGFPVTFINNSDIASASFSGFKMLAVVSDNFNTSYGGLLLNENDNLELRQNDIKNFVNTGGGLLGFSGVQEKPYPYLLGFGSFSFNLGLDYEDITNTSEGNAVGVTDGLDGCCWHDEYSSFPSYFKVLATNTETGNAAVIGGIDVIITDEICTDGIDNDNDGLIDTQDPECPLPTATPTPTPTPTSTATIVPPTATATPTPTSTATVVPPTATPTPTALPTKTALPVFSKTPCIKVSPVPTATPTKKATSTRTPCPRATPKKRRHHPK